MKPMPPQDPTLDYYEKNAEKLAPRYEASRLGLLHSRLEEVLPKGKPILELGCGTGRDAAWLLGRGFNIQATDASPAMLRAALRLHPELRGRLRLLALPEGLETIPDESYGSVCALAMLMHLTEDSLPGVFREVRRVLEPGGLFFFSVSLSRPGMGADGRDESGRFFLIRDEAWWRGLAGRQGFRVLSGQVSGDGLDREEVRWLNVLARR